MIGPAPDDYWSYSLGHSLRPGRDRDVPSWSSKISLTFHNCLPLEVYIEEIILITMNKTINKSGKTILNHTDQSY